MANSLKVYFSPMSMFHFIKLRHDILACNVDQVIKCEIIQTAWSGTFHVHEPLSKVRWFIGVIVISARPLRIKTWSLYCSWLIIIQSTCELVLWKVWQSWEVIFLKTPRVLVNIMEDSSQQIQRKIWNKILWNRCDR